MKDVKKDKKCHWTACWTHPAKFLGIAFIVVATLLTLFTLDGFGIFGMFLVGLMLLRKSGCCCDCGCCSTSTYETTVCDVTPKSTPKKTAAKKE